MADSRPPVYQNKSNSAVMGNVLDERGRSSRTIVGAKEYELALHEIKKKHHDEEAERNLKALEKEYKTAEKNALNLAKSQKEEDKARAKEASAKADRLKAQLAKERALKRESEKEYAQEALQFAYEVNKKSGQYQYRSAEERMESLKEYYEFYQQKLDEALAERRFKEGQMQMQLAEDEISIKEQIRQANPQATEQELVDQTAQAMEVRKAELTQELGLNDLNANIQGYSKATSSAKTELTEFTKKNNKISLLNLKADERMAQAKSDVMNALKARQQAIEAQRIVDAKGASASAEELANAKTTAAASQQATSQAMGSIKGGVMATLIQLAIKAVGKALTNVANELTQSMSTLTEGMAKFNARVQGAGMLSGFRHSREIISENLGFTGLVSIKDTMNNLKNLADLGVAYNMEQRAFLQTISEKIASTFDAFDSNLLRLIRLQQADSTAARLGMEAQMTQLLNEQYMDTSYLNSAYDTVTQTLMEATSQMSREQAITYEYNVQKWIGSLSSLGLSDSAVQNIATAISYASSGDIEALSGRSDLMTLLGLAANRAKLDLGKMLTGGMQGDAVNALLESMVRYLKEIAEGEDNLAVRRTFGNVLGLTMSDFRAIYNMTENNIQAISKSTLTYETAREELDRQFKLVGSRMPFQERINTLFQNTMTTLAESIISSPIQYTTWLINDAVEDLTGGINIPILNMKATDLVKASMVLPALAESVPKIVSGIASGIDHSRWLDEENWMPDYSTIRGLGLGNAINDYFRIRYGDAEGKNRYIRGGNYAGLQTGSLEDISFSSEYIAGGSSSDYMTSAVGLGQERAKETEQLINRESQEGNPEKTEGDTYALIEEMSSQLLAKLDDMTVTIKIDPTQGDYFGGVVT